MVLLYNHGREECKWRIWKENEEKILREYAIEEILLLIFIVGRDPVERAKQKTPR